jgi:hypothetical protein
MIAVVINDRQKILSLHVCNLEYSLVNLMTSIDNFNRVWNSGVKKYKITEIYATLGTELYSDKTDIQLNKNTVFIKKHEMISKLFEFEDNK